VDTERAEAVNQCPYVGITGGLGGEASLFEHDGNAGLAGAECGGQNAAVQLELDRTGVGRVVRGDQVAAALVSPEEVADILDAAAAGVGFAITGHDDGGGIGDDCRHERLNLVGDRRHDLVAVPVGGVGVVHPVEQAAGTLDDGSIREVTVLDAGRDPQTEVAVRLDDVDEGVLAVCAGLVHSEASLGGNGPQTSGELGGGVGDRIGVGHEHVAVGRRLGREIGVGIRAVVADVGDGDGVIRVASFDLSVSGLGHGRRQALHFGLVDQIPVQEARIVLAQIHLIVDQGERIACLLQDCPAMDLDHDLHITGNCPLQPVGHRVVVQPDAVADQSGVHALMAHDGEILFGFGNRGRAGAGVPAHQEKRLPIRLQHRRRGGPGPGSGRVAQFDTSTIRLSRGIDPESVRMHRVRPRAEGVGLEVKCVGPDVRAERTGRTGEEEAAIDVEFDLNGTGEIVIPSPAGQNLLTRGIQKAIRRGRRCHADHASQDDETGSRRSSHHDSPRGAGFHLEAVMPVTCRTTSHSPVAGPYLVIVQRPRP